MSDRSWDPFGSGRMFAALWSPSQMMPGWTASFGALFNTVRQLLVGRDLTVTWGHSRVRLTVEAIEIQPAPRAISIGQFGDITAVASNVTIEDQRLPRVSAVLHNAHIHPGSPARLVAAPVKLQVEVPNELLNHLVQRVAGPMRPEMDEHGIATVTWAPFASLGHIEIEPAIAGSILILRPKFLVVLGRRWSLPRRTPRYYVSIPPIYGMSVADIVLQPCSTLLSLALPEWTFDLPRARWEDIVEQLRSAGGRLNLAGVNAAYNR